MDPHLQNQLPALQDMLGLDEAPVGVFYTDKAPQDAYAPKPGELPTREKEMQGAVDWQGVFSNFSCVLGNIWLARKKNKAAFISAERYGCPGGAFWSGFLKPQTETIIHYVSTGVPDRMQGEHYCDSPDTLRSIFDRVDPRPAPKPICVFKPLDRFGADEVPELVAFFARPEIISGLHQLAAYVTGDPEVVASPWSAACGSVVAWPLHYLQKGQTRAVIGGWDPSARKFFKTDELSFTVPYALFADMVERHPDSFLKTETWQTVRKKIQRSKKAWGEVQEGDQP
jgi:uncharacterized protein (DUF169 family)